MTHTLKKKHLIGTEKELNMTRTEHKLHWFVHKKIGPNRTHMRKIETRGKDNVLNGERAVIINY